MMKRRKKLGKVEKSAAREKKAVTSPMELVDQYLACTDAQKEKIMRELRR